MAQKQKRPSPLEDPPTASSSSESEEEDDQPLSQVKHAAAEEEELSSEEEGSSEEEEEDETTAPAPPAATTSHTKPPQPEPESDSATQSDSESDTDSDQAPSASAPTPNPKVKPLATKPMDQTQTHKPKAQPSPAPAKSAAKRAAESNATAGDSKRAKKKAVDSAPAAAAGSDEEMEEDGKKSGNDSKKQFTRLWSDEDEIAILKGLADFISKTGNDPLKYPDAFYDFVIRSLQADATRTQVKDKVRRLKKKFQTLAGKGKNGETPKFPKVHDQKTFELAKKVWGSGANEAAASEEKPKANGKPAKSPKKEATSGSKNVASSAKKAKAEARQEPPQPESDMQVVIVKESAGKVVDTDVKTDTSVLLSEMFRYGVTGLNEDVVKKGLELIGASKRAELDGRWKKIQVAELELFAKRAQLIDEQTRLILEAFKSSRN